MLRIKKTMKTQTRLALVLCLALSAMATTRGGQAPVTASTSDGVVAAASAKPVTLTRVSVALADSK